MTARPLSEAPSLLLISNQKSPIKNCKPMDLRKEWVMYIVKLAQPDTRRNNRNCMKIEGATKLLCCQTFRYFKSDPTFYINSSHYLKLPDFQEIIQFLWKLVFILNSKEKGKKGGKAKMNSHINSPSVEPMLL